MPTAGVTTTTVSNSTNSKIEKRVREQDPPSSKLEQRQLSTKLASLLLCIIVNRTPIVEKKSLHCRLITGRGLIFTEIFTVIVAPWDARAAV